MHVPPRGIYPAYFYCTPFSLRPIALAQWKKEGWMEEGAISRPVVNSEGGFAHRSLSHSGPPWRSNALMYCIGDVRLLRLRHQIPL